MPLVGKHLDKSLEHQPITEQSSFYLGWNFYTCWCLSAKISVMLKINCNCMLFEITWQIKFLVSSTSYRWGFTRIFHCSRFDFFFFFLLNLFFLIGKAHKFQCFVLHKSYFDDCLWRRKVLLNQPVFIDVCE